MNAFFVLKGDKLVRLLVNKTAAVSKRLEKSSTGTRATLLCTYLHKLVKVCRSCYANKRVIKCSFIGALFDEIDPQATN